MEMTFSGHGIRCCAFAAYKSHSPCRKTMPSKALPIWMAVVEGWSAASMISQLLGKVDRTPRKSSSAQETIPTDPIAKLQRLEGKVHIRMSDVKKC